MPAELEDPENMVLPNPGPGVHVLVHADPAVAARELAEQLGAEIAEPGAPAERAVRARLGLPPGPPPDRGAASDASAERVDLSSAVPPERLSDDPSSGPPVSTEAAPPPPATADDVTRLRHLAASLALAERVRRNTEALTGERLAASLNTSLAVHPDTLRRAAAVVIDDEAVVAGLESEIGALGEEPVATAVATPASTATPAPDDQGAGAASQHVPEPLSGTEPFERPSRGASTRSTLVAVGLVVLGIAAAVGILVAGLPLLAAVAAALIGLIGAALALRSRARNQTSDTADRVRASETLAHAAAMIHVDSATGDDHAVEGGAHEPALDPQVARWRERRGSLDRQLHEAQERLASSRRQLAAVAGADADPHDLEAVMARNDPQYEVLSGVVDESPAVRATRAFHQQVQGAWTAAWTELGRPVPTASEGPELEGAFAKLTSVLPEPPPKSGSSSSAASTAERGTWPSAEVDPPSDGKRGRLRRRNRQRDVAGILGEGPPDATLDAANTFPTLVLVEPFSGLDTGNRRQLEDQLLQLDSALQVLIVVSEPLTSPTPGL